jgi:hypothetical protein
MKAQSGCKETTTEKIHDDPVEKDKRCPFTMTIYFKNKYGLFYLSRHVSGCEHKGNSKKTNLTTGAVHKIKSEFKTVKAMVQSHLRQGEQQISLKNLQGRYRAKQVAHLM